MKAFLYIFNVLCSSKSAFESDVGVNEDFRNAEKVFWMFALEFSLSIDVQYRS